MKTYLVHGGWVYTVKDGVLLEAPMGFDGAPKWDEANECDERDVQASWSTRALRALLIAVQTTF